MSNKTIDVLPDKDEVYTIEESDLMNSMSGYGILLHILEGSSERKVPENGKIPKVGNKENTGNIGTGDDSRFAKIVVWAVIIIILGTCVFTAFEKIILNYYLHLYIVW